jgi:hypothetical protein
LTDEFLADSDPKRNQVPLPGSLGDLVTRADGRPIYCTPSFAVRRALMNVIVGSLRREFPAAVFVHALTIYRNHNDWSRRWYSEHERYGAGILVTRAEDLPEGTDPFAGLAGEHVIGSRVGIEIKTLVRQGRPVAWHAVVFPANYWLSRFAIQPFNCISTSHYAGLLPAHTAEPFHPVIGPDFFRVVRG